MAIPAFNKDGFLPEGIYDCTLAELEDRFARFQESDRRCRLWDDLSRFLEEINAAGIIETVLVDGSFVTEKAAPNDIDLILVLPEQHSFAADQFFGIQYRFEEAGFPTV